MLTLLFLIALLGIGMAGLGSMWDTVARREKEAELLFVGDQFRQALESYYQRSPGQFKQYPKDLADLLEDPRFPMPVRHLRRIYPDPLTGKADWGLARDKDGMIIGVHSLSADAPLKTGNFPTRYVAFEGQPSYQDWVFGPALNETMDTGRGPAPEGGSQDGHDATMHAVPPDSGEQASPTSTDACLQVFQETVNACVQTADPAASSQCRQNAVRQYAECKRQA